MMPGTTPASGLRPLAMTVAALLVALGGIMAGACGRQGGEAERLNQEGNRLFSGGDYSGALDRYRRAAADRPDLTMIDYNAGNALHRLGQFDRAISESQKAAADGSNDTRFRAYHALGNHFFRQQKWREAYESYRNALILNPSDMDTKVNLEIALRRLTDQQNQEQLARQQQQAQPPQGPQGQNPQGQPAPQGGGQGQGPQQNPPGQGPGQGPQQQQPGGPQGQGQGQPQAGGQQQAGPGGGPAGTPTAGQPTTAGASGQDLQDALAQFERGLSIEDALRILDIIAEQQRQQQQRIPLAPPGSNIRDQ